MGQGSPISGSLLPPTVLVATSPALNFHVLVVALFWFGLVVLFTEEVNIGSDSQETDNAHACSLKCKSTFTHKVQVSASRRATGAVLPIWLTLFRMCFSISVILHSGAFESHRTVLIFLCSPLLSMRTLLFLCSHHFQLTACGSTGVTSLLSPFRKHTIFPPWWKCQPASADILLTGLSFQEEEARFASQEVDVDLEQLRRRGYPPRSLYLRRVGWWGKFLKERTR